MKKPDRLEPTQSESESNKSLRRTDWAARTHDAVTKYLLAEDARYFMKQESSTPCLSVVTQAEGAYIEDAKGRHHLDFHGNNAHHIGYGHTRLKEAITRQMDALPFAPRRFASKPVLSLAKKLTSIAPGDLAKVLFTTGGSDAVEVALKIRIISSFALGSLACQRVKR